MAGWSLVQAPVPVPTTVAGTTGKSLAFASPVTEGNVIVIGALYAESTTAPTWTFSDSESNTYTQLGTQLDTNVGAVTAIAFAIADSSAACTPAWVNNQATSTDAEIYVGEFAKPTGTVSQDGAATTATASASTDMVTPAGGGSGSNDLLINMLGFASAWGSWGGAWASMGTPPSTGNACGFLLNAAGNATPNAVSSASGVMSLVVALQSVGGPTQTLDPDADITTTGWTPSTGSTLFGVLDDASDADWASATLS